MGCIAPVPYAQLARDMDAAAQANVATNVVRVLGMNQPNHNDDLALRCCGFNRILLILLKRGCQMK